MLRRLNYFFWRNRAFWLLAVTLWGYLNVPAMVAQQDAYTSTLQFIIGVIISFVGIPVVMGLFYIVLFLTNVILKVPILVSAKEINGKYENDNITVTQGSISKTVPLNAISTVLLKKQYIVITTPTSIDSLFLAKSEIGNEAFNSITDALNQKSTNYSYKLITKTDLWVWLTILYVLTIWACWSAFGG